MAAANMAYRVLSLALDDLRIEAWEVTEQQRLVECALQKTGTNALRMAFMRWKMVAAEHLQRSAGGALEGMRQRALSMALNQWISVVVKMVQQKSLMSSASQRMVYIATCMAFDQWQAMTSEMVQQDRLEGGALQRMLRRALSMAFNQWISAAAEMVRQSRLIHDTLRRSLRVAFGQWQSVAIGKVHHGKQARMLYVWVMQGLWDAVEKWRNSAAELYAQECGILTAVESSERRVRRSTLRRLREQLHSVLDEKAAVGGALLRVLQAKVSKAFNQWNAVTEAMVLQSIVIGSALNKMVQRTLSMAFNHWRATADRMLDEKELVVGALLTMLQKALSMAFQQWHAVAHTLLDHHQFMICWLAHWRIITDSALDRRWMLTAAVEQHDGRLQSLALLSWQTDTTR